MVPIYRVDRDGTQLRGWVANTPFPALDFYIMPVTSFGEVFFHHNNDYSGDVIIRAPDNNDPSQFHRVVVPFVNLQELVANRIRHDALTKIEQTPPLELLQGLDPDAVAIDAMVPQLAAIADEEDNLLDDLVHDLVSTIGSDINNDGTGAQVGFIVERLGAAQAAATLRRLLHPETL